MPIRAQACRDGKCRKAGMRCPAHEAARRSRAAFAIISLICGTRVSITCTDFRCRTPGISARPPCACTLPFAILSDAKFALTGAMRLPTFTIEGMELQKRVTLVIDDGRVTHVFYPVFPPDKSAEETLRWLRANRSR